MFASPYKSAPERCKPILHKSVSASIPEPDKVANVSDKKSLKNFSVSSTVPAKGEMR